MNAVAFSARGLPLVVAALLVAAVLANAARAQAPIPDAKRAEFMIKTTLVALNQANLTGNYTVLRDLGSPRFRASNDAARLAILFTPLRERDLDLSPVVVFEPVLVQPIVSDEMGRLRLTGFVPTRPLRVVFDLAYEPIGNRWMVSDIAVNVAPWPDEAGQAPRQDSSEPDGPDPQAPEPPADAPAEKPKQ